MSSQITRAPSRAPVESIIAGVTSRWAQRALAVVAALALVGLLFAIGLQVAATQPGSKPAKVVSAQAGAYPLSVSLYKDPADAGYALPFAVAPSHSVAGPLTYSVTAIPNRSLGVDATQVSGIISRDPHVANGVTGTVEITVQGPWDLQITVDGPAGHGIAFVPITAKPAVVIPTWIAWPIGLLPAIGLALFFLAQRRRSAEPVAANAP
jgi:hypothetical protein